MASIGPGIDVVLQREVAARPVADVHEVEQLREPALAFGLDGQHLVHALLDDLAGRVEPQLQPLVLEAVPQLDEREQLAGDVAVLTPAADLVVVELGVLVPERGRLRVLVDVALPAVRGDTAERAAAVDDRDRAADAGGRARAPGSRRR